MKRNHKDKSKEKDKDKLKNSELFNHDDLNYEPDDDEQYTIDDDDLVEEEQELLKGRKKLKLVKVFDLLGKPREYSYKVNDNPDKNKYINLLALLEKQNIIVHFNNDYTLKEKYDFIVNEVFAQFVELDRKNSNKIFIYEDYHPEKYSDLEDDEEFI